MTEAQRTVAAVADAAAKNPQETIGAAIGALVGAALTRISRPR